MKRLCKYCEKEFDTIKNSQIYCSRCCQKHFGVTSPLKNKQIQQKASKTYKTKTGYANPSQNPDIKSKKEQTCLKNFGVRYPGENKKIKLKQEKTLMKSFGCKNPSQSEIIKQKKRQTMRKNNSYGKSKEEEVIYQKLRTCFDGIKRQYVSDLYPFSCDFYVPQLDLYIEYQGFWSHGKEPYNPKKKEHKQILKLWEEKTRPQYKSAIHTWTIMDPLKRKIAKKNKLNWLEFFTLTDFDEWYEKIKLE